MFKDKTDEDVLAIYTAAILDEYKATAGISNKGEDLKDLRNRIEAGRREILKRLKKTN